MRRLLAAALFLVVTHPSLATEMPTPAKGPSRGHFILGLGMGAGIPLSGGPTGYDTALGGQLMVGYAFDGNFSLYLASQSCIFQTSIPSVALTEFVLAPTAKYSFGDSGLKPYLCGGIGYNIAKVHTLSDDESFTYFAAQAGAGLELSLDKGTSLFLEGKYTHIFSDPSSSYLPIVAGVIMGL